MLYFVKGVKALSLHLNVRVDMWWVRLHHTISVIQVFQVGEGCLSDTPKLILSGAPHDPVYNKIEKQCRHNTPMFDISVDFQ